MNLTRVALWILGPIGSGKSTLANRTLPEAFRLVDQDAELEREAIRLGLPLDCRQRTQSQSDEFSSLRKAVADELWSHLPQWRSEGCPLAFETPGDKPHLLYAEVAAGLSAGYRNFGIALPAAADVCIARNHLRSRVVPDHIVRRTVADFDRNLRDGTYQPIFEPHAFIVVTNADAFDIGEWLATVT